MKKETYRGFVLTFNPARSGPWRAECPGQVLSASSKTGLLRQVDASVEAGSTTEPPSGIIEP